MAAAPAPRAASVTSVRPRPGTATTAITTMIGSVISQPRLWPSIVSATSTLALPMNRPRSSGGTSRRPASSAAGQNAAAHIAVFAFA